MPRPPVPSTSPTLSRRRFLAGSAAAAAAGAALALPGCRGIAAGAGGRGRVAVVGAGLAGLVAALELERDDFEVVLLEARDRIGGRVRTARNPFFSDQSAELGGEYIDASHRVLIGYVRRLGLDLDDLRGLGANLRGVVYTGGRRRPYEEVVTPEVQAEIDRFDARVAELARGIDPADPATGAGAARLDERSVADLLDELELEDTARARVERELRDEYTVEPDRLSLLFHAALTSLYAGARESGTEAFRIDGGNERLLDALIEEIDTKSDLEARVTRIEQRADRVVVFVDSGREVEADYAILTVPLPLAAEIDFRPALPGRVAEATRTLQYGTATKTPLQYGRRLWVTDGLDGDAITDLPIGTTWDATSAQTGRPGILMTYASGADGRRFGERTDSDRIAEAAAQVERVFPEAKGRLEAGATVAWSDEEYARGSYAAYAPGQVTRYWRALREPVGRLYLAGDHTDAYTGYMEGAIRSGRRAARAIAKRAK